MEESKGFRGQYSSDKNVVFLGSLNRHINFTQDMLGLSRAGKEILVKRKMIGVPDLVGNPEYIKTESEEERQVVVKYLTKEMEKSHRQKIDNNDLWILNQALIMLCMVMDAYFETLLESVLRRNVRILYGVSGAKNIELKHIVELGSLDAVIDEFRNKEIRNFSFEEIEKRFKYMESRLGIDIPDIFDWQIQNEEVQERLKGWDLNTLVEIYGKRHAIVHRDELPIKTLDELVKIRSFFVQIVANLSLLISKKHDIYLDLNLMMSQPELYKQFKAELSKRSGE